MPHIPRFHAGKELMGNIDAKGVFGRHNALMNDGEIG
jgi:hypothetical protein